MMVFSGLLKPVTDPSARWPRSNTKNGSSSSIESVLPQPSETTLTKLKVEYILDESQLHTLDGEPPDLRELNSSLEALAAIFPDVQVEVFREMLTTFDEESRLAVVTEALLKHKMKWAKGRYRVVGKDTDVTVNTKTAQPDTTHGVPIAEKFRSKEYKEAVRSTTYREFKGLSKSAINAVLAEHNFSYTLARPTLVNLSSKSWRYSIQSFILRRKPSSLETEQHPLLVWQSTGRGSIVPSIKLTGSVELDRELFTTLVAPLQAKYEAERVAKDHSHAVILNYEEAEKNEALHDCECCYSSTTFEELTACNSGGHMLCYNCVRNSINEAIYGQGWSKNIDISTGSLRCIAPTSDDCHGVIPQELIRRALLDAKGGDETRRKLDERLAEANLLTTGLPLIRCPFCPYAEIDDLYLPETQNTWHFRRHFSLSTTLTLIFFAGMIPLLFLAFLFLFTLGLIALYIQPFNDFARKEFQNSILRLRRRRRGLKFVCQSPRCGRGSCLSCGKPWRDIHICHESSLLDLRTQVELAMSLAIKRTCPKCNTSFVKSSGCNKLTCICGYQMCYVCRKDIGGGEGYRHFCEHFRPTGSGGCEECNKCDLYRTEDEEVVVRKARAEAERRWLEKEGVDKEKAKVMGKFHEESPVPLWSEVRIPGWREVLDDGVDGLIE
jgi:hypothetical protein